MRSQESMLIGRKILIMGASGPPAEALARRFFEAGANLALTTSSTSGDEAFALSRLARRLSQNERIVRAESVDMSHMSSVQVAQRKLAKDLGGLDILVAMPELRSPGPAERMSEADWASVLGTNLGGVFFACKAAAREMSQGGSILILTGEVVQLDPAGEAAYAAATAGAKALAGALDLEWRTKGIAVSSLEIPSDPSRHPEFVEKVLILATAGDDRGSTPAEGR